MAIEHINCEACGKDDAGKVVSSDNFCYVRCRNCGLIYLNPRHSEDSIEDMYKGADHTLIDPRQDPTGEEGLYLSRFYDKVREIEKFQKKKGKMLDIGSAWGFFLSVAEKEGWEPYGVELSLTEGKYSRDRFGLNIFAGKLSEAGFPPGYFDVVTLWHVLEHMPHPYRELSEVKRIMKPNGLLVIEVPNARMLLDDTKQDNFKPLHLFYYDAATLRSLLERAGFQVIKTEGCGNTRILMKADRLKLHFIKAFAVRHFDRLKGIKKLILRLKAAFNMQENIIFYARPVNFSDTISH